MDIFTLIQEDHQKVIDLLEKLQSTSGKREQLFAQLKEELELHSHAEEQVFYPAIQELQEAEDIIEEALQDHELVAELLKDLATTPNKDSEAWAEKLALLEENVQEHIEEEESAVFDVARQLFTDDQMQALTSRWQAAKQEQPAGKSSR